MFVINGVQIDHPLFLSRIVEDLYDLLDAAVGREIIASDRDPDRVLQEGACEPSDGLGPRRTDCVCDKVRRKKRMSRRNVDRHIIVWRFAPCFVCEMMLLMSFSKPLSSMRSASSKTR